MARPRILLVPSITELDWQIRPLLEEWAEVATYDPPGVGDEPPAAERDPRALLGAELPVGERTGWEACVVPGDEPVVARGIAELDRRGWERCIVVGDEFGAPIAAGLAAAAPDRVEGLALGHACLSLSRTGDRPAVNSEVFAGFLSLIHFDYRTFARTLTQVTQGAYDEELTERYIERVPQELQTAILELTDRHMDGLRIEEALRGLGVPLLLVEHSGCLMWTHEGFADAVAAFPAAERASLEQKPSVSPEFVDRLREFCGAALPAPGEPAAGAG